MQLTKTEVNELIESQFPLDCERYNFPNLNSLKENLQCLADEKISPEDISLFIRNALKIAVKRVCKSDQTLVEEGELDRVLIIANTLIRHYMQQKYSITYCQSLCMYVTTVMLEAWTHKERLNWANRGRLNYSQVEFPMVTWSQQASQVSFTSKTTTAMNFTRKEMEDFLKEQFLNHKNWLNIHGKLKNFLQAMILPEMKRLPEYLYNQEWLMYYCINSFIYGLYIASTKANKDFNNGSFDQTDFECMVREAVARIDQYIQEKDQCVQKISRAPVERSIGNYVAALVDEMWSTEQQLKAASKQKNCILM